MFGLPIPIIGLLVAVFVLVFLVLRTARSCFYCHVNCGSDSRAYWWDEC